MHSIPIGDWHIERVTVNETTVMSDSIRGLEIHTEEWVIHQPFEQQQPSEQHFRIRQTSGKSVVLESNGQVYYADYEVNGSKLSIKMFRPNIQETIAIEAIAITADVYSST